MKSFPPKPWLLPQPVIIIGTYDAEGRPNAMNAAWTGTWDMREIMVSLGPHATLDHLRRCPDFTIGFATTDTLREADYVGIVSAHRDPDKMARTGWTSQRAQLVEAPVFDPLPMTLECRVKRRLDESETGCYVIAEVLNIQAHERYLAPDGKPDVQAMRLITFDPIHNTYIRLGDTVGRAFHDGKELKGQSL